MYVHTYIYIYTYLLEHGQRVLEEPTELVAADLGALAVIRSCLLEVIRDLETTQILKNSMPYHVSYIKPVYRGRLRNIGNPRPPLPSTAHHKKRRDHLSHQ
jgi:hypothetical protein